MTNKLVTVCIFFSDVVFIQGLIHGRKTEVFAEVILNIEMNASNSVKVQFFFIFFMQAWFSPLFVWVYSRGHEPGMQQSLCPCTCLASEAVHEPRSRAGDIEALHVLKVGVNVWDRVKRRS